MKSFIKKYWYFFLPIIPAIFFALSIFDGSYYIGGDVMIPLYKGNIFNRMYLWNSAGDSLEFLHLPWYIYFGLFGLFDISGEIAQKILIIALFVIGFIFNFLLYKELLPEKNNTQWAFLSGLIYVLSPTYFLLVTAYLPLYGFPVCLYFLTKFIKTSSHRYSIAYGLALNLFLFIDLPQPKIILVFFLVSIGIVTLLKHSSELSLKTAIYRFFILNIQAVLINFWIVLPYVYNIFYGQISSFSSNLSSHHGTADLYTASLLYISRFFNYSIVRLYPALGNFLTSLPFIIWSFIGLGILGVSIQQHSDQRSKKVKNILLAFFLVLAFIAKGPNPPFGEIYTKIMVSVPLLRIFRTTSSVILGASIFYSLLIPFALAEISKKYKLKSLFAAYLIGLLAISYPIFLGYKYSNVDQKSQTSKGYKIPQEYFSISQKLDKLDKNYTILQLPFPDGYVLKNWGYFGADILYWSSNVQTVHRPDQPGLSLEEYSGLTNFYANNDTVLSNVSHILIQKDSVDSPNCDVSGFGRVTYSDQFFNLVELDKQYYYPRLYSTTSASTISAGLSGRFLKFIDPTLKNSLCVKLSETKPKNEKKPSEVTTEFQRINATEYSVKINTAITQFTLVLNEKYSTEWKIYGQKTKIDLKQIKVGGYANGWEIDTKTLCGAYPDVCLNNQDGSTTIQIKVEYFPQKLFTLGLKISIFTFVGLMICSLYKKMTNKNEK